MTEPNGSDRSRGPGVAVTLGVVDFRFVLLLACFFASGFAALLYQTAWTREFGFLFGTSELAVVAVLAAYMAGLALGAAAASRFVARIRRPVVAYAVLELGIGLLALAVPAMRDAVQALYVSVIGGLPALPQETSLWTSLFQLAGAFVVLVPCTALMGATLPLLAHHAVESDEQIASRSGLLYATNTFGAIAGTLVAAFVLLPWLGLRTTVYVGIGVNALVFGLAALLARGFVPRDAPVLESAEATSRGAQWVLPAILVSGAVSFTYEVLWTRLLGQVLGGSTAAFASMLASFLTGIALGSGLASRFVSSRAAAIRGFAGAQVGIGAFGAAAFLLANRLPALAAWVGADRSDPLPGAAIGGLLLLPMTFCIGATFPFAVRIFATRADEAGAVSGVVYAWNTVGSIVGALVAGFVLLPGLGLEGTALAAVVTSLVLAMGARSAGPTSGRARTLAVVAGAIVVVFVLGLPRPDGLLRHAIVGGADSGDRLAYVGVGRSATVTVLENEFGSRLLTNGLPESGVDRPELPDRRFNESAWLSLLPTAVRPATSSMLLIGLGGGNTLAATPQTVREIDVVELEEEVVLANRLLSHPVDPLARDGVRLIVGDARGAMMLSDRRYDAVVSQPSHPWTSGASHLYTREFFARVRDQLEPEGVFIQWVGSGFVDESLFGSVIAALKSVFAHVEVFRPTPVSLVFVASPVSFEIAETGAEAIALARPAFASAGIHRVEDLVASRLLDDAGVTVLSSGWPANSDDHNRLATRRAASEERAEAFERLERRLRDHEPHVPAALASLEPAAVVRRMGWNGEVDRAHEIAATLEGTAGAAARGWLALDGNRLADARRAFEAALRLDPDDGAARAGLLTMVLPSRGEGLPEANWTSDERAVFDALRDGAAGDWDSVEGRDDALARFGPDHLLFSRAAKQRARWRVASGDPARAREAIALLDQVLSRHRSPANYLERLRAAVAAGEHEMAWIGLHHLVYYRMPPDARFARRVLRIASALGDPGDDPLRVQVLRRLGAVAR